MILVIAEQKDGKEAPKAAAAPPGPGVEDERSTIPSVGAPVGTTCCHQVPVSSSRMMKFWLLMPARWKVSRRPSSSDSHTRPV